MRTTRQRGFTLIELMITVAIVAILAAIAYPSYTSHIRKGVRRAAQAQMMDIANREQQFLLSNRTYVSYGDLQTSGYSLPTDLTAKYTPSVASEHHNDVHGHLHGDRHAADRWRSDAQQRGGQELRRTNGSQQALHDFRRRSAAPR